MNHCTHQELVLLERRGRKLRCRRCHLTIDEEELGQGCCPECLEAGGGRHRDFEEVESGDGGKIVYRCERCGAIIETD